MLGWPWPVQFAVELWHKSLVLHQTLTQKERQRHRLSIQARLNTALKGNEILSGKAEESQYTPC